MPGREATMLVKASGEQPGREVKLIAEPRPRTLALGVVTLLDQIAGALVVLGAAYLVWIRPGAMTWALFAYTIQFDPGQSFQFYAWLQQWPRALLAQDVASCVLQAAGCRLQVTPGSCSSRCAPRSIVARGGGVGSSARCRRSPSCSWPSRS